jgi:small subunit ribosomal protein S11
MKGFIKVKFSYNNTIFSLTRENGEVLANVSGGSVVLNNNKKVTGARKGSPAMAEKTVEEIIKKAKEKGIDVVILEVKGIGSGRKVAIKKVRENKYLKVEKFSDTTPVSFSKRLRKR